MFPFFFDYNKCFDGGQEGYIGEGGSKARQERRTIEAVPIGFAVSHLPYADFFRFLSCSATRKEHIPHSIL